MLLTWLTPLDFVAITDKMISNKINKIEFEGKYYQTFCEYDNFLKIKYGDYMNLPPVSERNSHMFDAYIID